MNEKILLDYTGLVLSQSPFIIETIRRQYGGDDLEDKLFELVYDEEKLTWKLNIYY